MGESPKPDGEELPRRSVFRNLMVWMLAFGLGVERLCMRRHNITDIREFYRNDVRFLSQF